MALPGILATALLALPPLTAGTAGLQTPAAEEQDALIDSFNRELQRLRAGEDDALTPLQELADRLCADFDRCDKSDILKFYAQLPPRARLAGLEAERRYLALRGRVIQARRDGLDWPEERKEILTGLRELVLEVQVDSDFVPAAQALVLCAQIGVHGIENDPLLSNAERAAAIEQVADDARDAKALFEASGPVVPCLELYLVLGRLERLRGHPSRAREFFERCYEESRRLRNDASAADALHSLLTLAIDAGDVIEQERQLRRLASYRAPTESWLVTRGWGQLLLNANHPERALEFMSQHAPRDEFFPYERRDWHLLMGGALMRLGMHAEARAHFSALEEDASSSTLATLALTRLAIEEGRPDEALERLEEPGFREEVLEEDLDIWHALVGEALLATEGPEAALADLQKAIELADTSGRPALGEAETTARSVMGAWLGLHTVALLADVHARLGRPLDALAAIEDSQSRSLRRIESELQRARVNAGLAGKDTLVTRGEVLSWARHAELGLITWVVGANFTLCAWAIPQGGEGGDGAEPRMRAEAQRVDLGRQRLEDGVRRLREAAVGGDDAAVPRIAAELRDSLLPPTLLQRLRDMRELGDPDARLLVLLHGPLERLPVELFELDGVPFDRFLTVLTLPGLPATQPGAEPALGHDRWILAGAPTEIGPWPELPGARQEIADLGVLYGGSRTLVGPAFTLPAMRAVLRGPDPLHIATHLVEECEHPGRRLAPVSLLLSGGELLCTHDVADIGPRAPLVILSACATAEGRYLDAEGLTGLARAFLESGTRNVLVTLWPVEDRAAQAFAKAFHAVLAGGVQPSRAAREAREALRAEGWGPAAVGAFRVLGRD